MSGAAAGDCLSQTTHGCLHERPIRHCYARSATSIHIVLPTRRYAIGVAFRAFATHHSIYGLALVRVACTIANPSCFQSQSLVFTNLHCCNVAVTRTLITQGSLDESECRFAFDCAYAVALSSNARYTPPPRQPVPDSLKPCLKMLIVRSYDVPWYKIKCVGLTAVGTGGESVDWVRIKQGLHS